nr:DUF393 domain-containing protein [Hufsiella ginkgonis]
MCSLYTRGLAQAGLLDKNGRASYQEISAGIYATVDMQRAVNEIALVNTETGEVTYGIRSLFKVLANAMPVLGALFHFGPFVWVMSKIYAFISFNRRVIVPPTGEAKYMVQPSFKLHYRLFYLFVTWLVTAYILSRYTLHLKGILVPGPWYREYFVCGGQILFQGIVAGFYANEKRWTYLGNMMTISLAGALLLLPVMWCGKLAGASPLYFAVGFMGVAFLMFLEHIRRMKILELGWLMTVSWIVYRLALLFIIT